MLHRPGNGRMPTDRAGAIPEEDGAAAIALPLAPMPEKSLQASGRWRDLALGQRIGNVLTPTFRL